MTTLQFGQKPYKEYPLVPKFWQPKVAPSVQNTSQIYHWQNLTAITRGEADELLLWDWVESGLTYSEMMRLLEVDGTDFTGEAKAAIAEQIEIQPAIVARFRRTGKIGFSGTELNIAKAAAHVMDSLITMDRHGIAWAAREWSNAQMVTLKAAAQGEIK